VFSRERVAEPESKDLHGVIRALGAITDAVIEGRRDGPGK
jgi:hypothetical protein